MGTDSGFNHLIRPILYGAWHPVENLTNPGGTPGASAATSRVDR